LNTKDENSGSQVGRGLSVKDRSQLTHAYETLCKENNNILFIGDDEDHLDNLFMEFYSAIREDEGLFTHRLLSPTMEEFTALINKLVDRVTIEQALVNKSPLRHVIFVPDVVRETQSEWAACESALSAIPGVQVRMVSCARQTAIDLDLLSASLKKSVCEIIFFEKSPPSKTILTKSGDDTEYAADSALISHEPSAEQWSVWDRSPEKAVDRHDFYKSMSLTARVISCVSKPGVVFFITFNLALFVLWSEYIVLPDIMRDFFLQFGEILLNLWSNFLAEVRNLQAILRQF
jgi:hypothetical protein